MKAIIIGGRADELYFNHAKLDRPKTEIWGINAIRFQWVPYWSRMFNLHTYDRLYSHDWPVEQEREWCMDHPKVPFYALDQWPKGWIPDLRIFPGTQLRKMPRGDYHCGTFDWLVAFAVYLGHIREIEFHGVGLERMAGEGGEPISARACLEYWCGYAVGRGIKITCAEDCSLFQFFHVVKSNLIYSYDDTPLVEDRTTKEKDDADLTRTGRWSGGGDLRAPRVAKRKRRGRRQRSAPGNSGSRPDSGRGVPGQST